MNYYPLAINIYKHIQLFANLSQTVNPCKVLAPIRPEVEHAK